MLSRFAAPTRSLAAARTTPRFFSVHAARFAEKDNSALDGSQGSVGREFQADGKIGGTAEKVGGPFSKDGSVGKQFTEDGAVGGTAQDVAEQAQGDQKSVFDKDGAVGKHFKKDGAIGQIGEKIGGPFASDGAIGKNFNPDGAVGGTAQEKLNKK